LGNFGTGGAQFEHAPQLSGGCIFLTILNWIKIINSKSKIGLMNKISAYFRDSYRELLETDLAKLGPITTINCDSVSGHSDHHSSGLADGPCI